MNSSSGQHLTSLVGQDFSPKAPVVYVVDDDRQMRERLERVLRSAGWQSRAAASAEEFLSRLPATGPCCLLVEHYLPARNGLDLQGVLRDRTEMPIIFMSRYADVRTSVRAIKAGALEFLTKPFGDEALLSAVEDAIEQSRAALRDQACARELGERYASLSQREREVMRGVASGRLNKQVAGDLGISEITVKAHRGSAMRKMRASSFAELVIMAVTLGRGTRLEDERHAERDDVSWPASTDRVSNMWRHARLSLSP
jgi:FixJ family two-component response regulator